MLSCPRSCFEDLLRGIAVRPEDSRDLVTECHPGGTRQSGHVDREVGFVTLGQPEPIGKNKTTLSVGVEHLDRRPFDRSQDISRPRRIASNGVVGDWRDACDSDREAESRYGDGRRGHDRRPRHVIFHFLHGGR